MGRILLFPVVLLPACDPDCERPSRLDGRYNVWSNVVEHTPPVDDVPAEYPADEVFYNGHSEWRLRYVQSQRAFDLEIDDQRYSAAFEAQPGNCNAFALGFGGVFVSPGGTEHDFAWQGDLVYFGTHLGGTWVYESDWEDLGTDTRGHVWSRGELRSTTTGDTGY